MRIYKLSVFIPFILGCSESGTQPIEDKSLPIDNIRIESIYSYTPENRDETNQNIDLILSIEKQLIAEGLPAAEKFISPHKVTDNLATKIGRKNLKLAGAYPGKLLYQSDGQEYKIIIINNGDCYIIRDLAPKMVDPARSTGPIDCQAYGVWSENGSEF